MKMLQPPTNVFTPTPSNIRSAPPTITTQSTPMKKPRRQEPTSYPSLTALPMDLGKCVDSDVLLLQKLGWEDFVKEKRKRGDIGSLDFKHEAKRLLKGYKSRGAPVKMKTKPWRKGRLMQTLLRGAHKSCFEHLSFLQEEFIQMIEKKQWVILPYEVAKDLPGLRLSPPGCVPQRDRRPRWICDYSFYDVNQETIELFAEDAMQFGHALERFLRQILLADPKLGPIELMKVDISDGFYRICLSPGDIPKLGVVFPTMPGQPKLVALPLVLPMGWKNSPPIFSTATETIADIANKNITDSLHTPKSHPLSALASTFDQQTAVPSSTIQSNFESPANCTLTPTPSLPLPTMPSQEPNAMPTSTATTPSQEPSAIPISTAVPTSRDPSLPSQQTPGYIDVFVDDFLCMIQGKKDRDRVRSTLMNAIDLVFRPNDKFDLPTRSEPISVKKLKKGDCSWSTSKTVLGWIIDTVNLTIALPAHRVQRLAEILASIPSSQKRISTKKWHKVLGELRSMSLALPGARHLFSHMQLALTHQQGARVALRKGVHHAVNDFKLLLKDIDSRPTRIAEIIPLNNSATGHHDASGQGAGGVWFPSNHIARRDNMNHGTPLLWRFQWPDYISKLLVTTDNPQGTITNSDLELAGGLLHLQALAQSCDIRERTVLSKTDNLATLFWQRKGSATTDKCPAHLLRLFGFHQRFHRYVPRHDYLSGPSNPLADAASRLFHLNDKDFLTHLNSLCPQKKPLQLLQLEPGVISSVISALLRKQSNTESLAVEPAQPGQPGPVGKISVSSWPSTPYSKPSKAKYQSYRSLHNVFDQEKLHQKGIQSALERLRITYGTLGKRSSTWGPKIRGTTQPNNMILD